MTYPKTLPMNMKLKQEVVQVHTTRVVSLAVEYIGVKKVRQFLKVRIVCCVTQEPSMKVLCIHATSVTIRQQTKVILRDTNYQYMTR